MPTADFVWSIVLAALVNGLVTWGVVKATLRFLEKGIDEAKGIGSAAHKRIDNLIFDQRRTA